MLKDQNCCTTASKEIEKIQPVKYRSCKNLKQKNITKPVNACSDKK